MQTHDFLALEGPSKKANLWPFGRLGNMPPKGGYNYVLSGEASVKYSEWSLATPWRFLSENRATIP